MGKHECHVDAFHGSRALRYDVHLPSQRGRYYLTVCIDANPFVLEHMPARKKPHLNKLWTNMPRTSHLYATQSRLTCCNPRVPNRNPCMSCASRTKRTYILSCRTAVAMCRSPSNDTLPIFDPSTSVVVAAVKVTRIVQL